MADDEEDDEGDHEYRGNNSPQGAIDRSWVLEEFRQKPWLLPHVLAVSAGENLDPEANLSVLESLSNRAAMMGTSIEEESRRSQEGGYYAGYNPAALNKPHVQQLLQRNLELWLGGSDVSNGATDNSSGSFADKRNENGMFQRVASYGGETFSRPGDERARGWNRYDAWRSNNQGGMMSNVGAGLGFGNGLPKGQGLDAETYARIYGEVQQANPTASPQVIARTVQYIASTMPKQHMKAVGPYDARKEERDEQKERRAQKVFDRKESDREAKKYELSEKRARAERADAKAQLNHWQTQKDTILSKIGSAVDNDVKKALQVDLKTVTDRLKQAETDFADTDKAYKRATLFHDDFVQHGVTHTEESVLADLKESAAKASSPEEVAAVQRYADKYGIDFNAQRHKMEQPISPADSEAAASPGMGAPLSTPNKVPNSPLGSSAFTDKEVRGMQAQVPSLPGAAPARSNSETLKEWGHNLSNIYQNTKKDVGDIGDHPEQIGATFRHANGGSSVLEDMGKNREEDWKTMTTNPFEGRDPKDIGFLENLMAHLGMFGAVSDMATGGALNTYGGRVNEQVAKTTGSKSAGDVAEIGAQLAIPMPAFGGAGKAAKAAEKAPEMLALPKPPIYAGEGAGWSGKPGSYPPPAVRPNPLEPKGPPQLAAPPEGHQFSFPTPQGDWASQKMGEYGRNPQYPGMGNSPRGSQLNLDFNALPPTPPKQSGPLALPKPSTIYGQPPAPQKLLPPPEQGPQMGGASSFPRQAPPAGAGQGPMVTPPPPNPYVNEPWAQGGIPAGYGGKGGVGSYDNIIHSNPKYQPELGAGPGPSVSGQPGLFERIMQFMRPNQNAPTQGASPMPATAPKSPAATPPATPAATPPMPAAPTPATPAPTSRFKIPSVEEQQRILDDRVKAAADKKEAKLRRKTKTPAKRKKKPAASE